MTQAFHIHKDRCGNNKRMLGAQAKPKRAKRAKTAGALKIYEIAGRELEKALATLSPLALKLRELYMDREPKLLSEVWDQLKPLLGKKASPVRFYFWQCREEGATELETNYLYPEPAGEQEENIGSVVFVNIFHSSKPKHFANLLPAQENNAELRGVSRGKDTGCFEGTVKLLANDGGASIAELVDYGQYAHGRSKGFERTPVFARDEFLNRICSTLQVFSTSNAVCQNCCAITSVLVGLLETQVFGPDELLSMLLVKREPVSAAPAPAAAAGSQRDVQPPA